MGIDPSTLRQGSIAELELGINLTSSCCIFSRASVAQETDLSFLSSRNS